MKQEVVVQISKGFDQDEKKLSPADQKALTDSLNLLADQASEGKRPVKLYRPHAVRFPETINRKDSSLYMYKATDKYNVVLSYENDIVYNQRIIALYRVVPGKQSVQAFNSTAKLLYER